MHTNKTIRCYDFLFIKMRSRFCLYIRFCPLLTSPCCVSGPAWGRALAWASLPGRLSVAEWAAAPGSGRGWCLWRERLLVRGAGGQWPRRAVCEAEMGWVERLCWPRHRVVRWCWRLRGWREGVGAENRVQARWAVGQSRGSLPKPGRTESTSWAHEASCPGFLDIY